MTDSQHHEDRLENLEVRAGALDQAAEEKHDRDTAAELENEYGYEGIGELAGNLVDTAAIAAFDEYDAGRKDVIDCKIAELRHAFDADESICDEALDKLERLISERAKHLGVDGGDS